MDQMEAEDDGRIGESKAGGPSRCDEPTGRRMMQVDQCIRRPRQRSKDAVGIGGEVVFGSGAA